MAATAPAAKCRPLLRSTCRSNLGAQPPKECFQSFQAEHSCYYETARKTPGAIMTSTADVVARRHRGGLEHQGGLNTWGTSWLGPHWLSCSETGRATHGNVADRKVVVARHRRDVVTTNTWHLRDRATVNSEGSEAFARNLSEKTTTKKTSELQKVISGGSTRVVTSTADAAARRHRGGLKHQGALNTWSTSWLGRHWLTCTETGCASHGNVADGKKSFREDDSQEDLWTPEDHLRWLDESRDVDGRCGGKATSRWPGTSRRLNTSSTSWVGPHWLSCTETGRATHGNVADGKVVVARHRRDVVATNTWHLRDGAAVNSEGSDAFARSLSEKTTTKKTSGLQKVISGGSTRVVTSTADAAARRNRGGLEHQGALNTSSTSWLGPHWLSCTETGRAIHGNVVDRKVVVARHRRDVVATNTWHQRDGATVNSEGSEAFARSLSEKTTTKKTSGLQKVISGGSTRVVTSTADAAARRHRGGREHLGALNTWSTSWLGPHWLSCTETGFASHGNVVDRKKSFREDDSQEDLWTPEGHLRWLDESRDVDGRCGGKATSRWPGTSRRLNTSSTSWVGPHWLSCTETGRATHGNVADGKVVVARHRRDVVATNTWHLRDGAAVNSEGSEAFARSLSEKTTTKKTSGLQKVISGGSTRVVTSTADAAARRHRGGLEHQGALNTSSTSWLGPHWLSCTETGRAIHGNVADRKVVVARHRRHVVATNTWHQRDGATVNSEGSEAFARSLSEKTTTKKTSGLQKVISGGSTRVVTSTADAAARRHRGGLEHLGALNTWSTSWLGPHWLSCTETGCASHGNVADRKVVVARHRRDVVATNTWHQRDGATVNSEGSEAFARSLSGKTTTKKTSGLQKVISGGSTRVVTSTADAAARRHRGGLEHQGALNTSSNSWLGPQLLSCTETGRATLGNVADRKVVVARHHRDVVATNTWHQRDGATVNSEGSEAFARSLSGKTTTKKTSGLQKVISGGSTRVVTSTADAAARKVVVARHRGDVVVTNTWHLRDGAAVNSEGSEAFARSLSGKTTTKKTSGLQKVISGGSTRVVTSTADAAARRHRGGSEHQGALNTSSTSWLGPHWLSCTETGRATHGNVADEKVVVARHRRDVVATNTWHLRDGAAVNSEGSEAFARSLSEKTTTKKTSGLQKVISGGSTRVVTSTADAAARRHRGGLEHLDALNTWSTLWLGPHWLSCSETGRATHGNVADRKVVVARHRRDVVTTNTWHLRDRATVNSEGSEAFARNLSEKTTTKKTSGLQKVISGGSTRVVTSTADAAARRHRGGLEHLGALNISSTSWLGPHWLSCKETGRATHGNVADRKVVVGRHRRDVVATNTWHQFDGATVNSEGSEAFARNLSGNTTTKKTSRLQKVISGGSTRVVTSTADAAARRHRGGLEHQGALNTSSNSWLGPQLLSCTETGRATHGNVADRKVVVARHRRDVVATNT
ncbi:hypothetical protein MRX96_001370 [Rhipicephalus microplus]